MKNHLISKVPHINMITLKKKKNPKKTEKISLTILKKDFKLLHFM